MHQDLTTQALGRIAREHPQAVGLFHRYGFDYCCGGKQTLAEAAHREGLDAEAIAVELLAATTPDNTDPGALPDSELIQHILDRYHAAHRAQLPLLIHLAEKVETVHAGDPWCPAGLAAHLRHMASELEMHMLKEEDILFPMILRGFGTRATAPISVMRHEHDDHADAIAHMLALCHNLNLPQDACTSWRGLYDGIAQLQRELMAHIHLENNVLFNRFDGQLGGFRHG